MSIDTHILNPLDFFIDFKQHELEAFETALKIQISEVLKTSSMAFFKLIQGNNTLGEKTMKKIDIITSKRRTITAGSQ